MSDLFFDAITFAMVIAIAELVRTRRAYAEIYAERAARMESEKATATSRAVDEERLRIARELHDVVAHSVTSIAVQSSVGLDQLRKDPDAAERALATIETSSRTALAEMRRMLGMLRQGDDGSASLVPAPGLAHVRSLVEEYAAAGITTSLVVDGERPRSVPPGVDLCCLPDRAGGAHQRGQARTWGAGRCQCQVVGRRCRRRGPRRWPRPGAVRTRPGTDASPGQGLLGMRERVGLFGGVLAAGPRPEGGFGVFAQLPFDAPRTGRLTPPAAPVSSA